MKKVFFVFAGVGLIVGSVAYQAATSTAASETSDILQFRTLKIVSVSASTVPAVIVATAITPTQTTGCIRFPSAESSVGTNTNCPQTIFQSVSGSDGYRIEVTASTKLMLRTRAAATLADFQAGDEMSVFGIYDRVFSAHDATVQALIVRNLSRPEEKHFVQLENMELLSIQKNAETSGATGNLVVFQEKQYPCYDFGERGDAKRSFPCPLGLNSFSDNPVANNAAISESRAAAALAARKYVVNFDAQTIILDRIKGKLSVNALAVGDKLNVYGVMGKNGTVDADIIRDISRPKQKPSMTHLEGIITQINSGDGSFTLRLRDGRTVTGANPVQTGIFVGINGIFNETTNIISDIAEIAIKNPDEKNAIPVILEINPGSGPIGTRVTLSGRSFTPQGNAITFAGIEKSVTNIVSPNGKILTFLIPTAAIEPGNYKLFVTNVNGVSNEINYQIIPAGALTITRTSFPQTPTGMQYSIPIEASGGTSSYVWSIASGTLPPGLELTSAVCIMAPCKAPATITGTPREVGTYTFTLALQSGNERTTNEFNIVIVPAVSVY